MKTMTMLSPKLMSPKYERLWPNQINRLSVSLEENKRKKQTQKKTVVPLYAVLYHPASFANKLLEDQRPNG